VAAGPPPTRQAVIFTALAANVAIAVAKAGASAITGSSAMLAEAIHSVADSVNEVLLLVGARRASRPADLRHPFGHARYRYLYAFVVSLAVFWIGGVLSVLEGFDHLINRGAIVDPRWALGVLVLAALLEGWSLRTTTRAWRTVKGELSWRRLLRDTKAPELIVVFSEDVGAIIGIAFAAIGVTLAAVTGAGMWDAIASIAIGILLMAVGLVVNRETQSLLVGEAVRSRSSRRSAMRSPAPKASTASASYGRFTWGRTISSLPQACGSTRAEPPPPSAARSIRPNAESGR
jgi:cation diffusion facilitator family transporter